MNLIACDKNCKHQRDGYCALSGIGAIASTAESDCCYYDKQNTQTDLTQISVKALSPYTQISNDDTNAR